MNMTTSKWVGHEFTPIQEKARKRWRRAFKQRVELSDGLRCSALETDRATLHKRLDRLLDSIEAKEYMARDDFQEVGESFTIASGTL